MMSDLHERLRAAITERKALAEELETYSPSSPWMASGNWVACFVDQHTCAGGTAESSYMHEPYCGYEPMFQVPDFMAAFIAASDPATVLRQCAEDLDVLERHRLRSDNCTCGGPLCSAHEHTDWPCDEVESLARRYDIKPQP